MLEFWNQHYISFNKTNPNLMTHLNNVNLLWNYAPYDVICMKLKNTCRGKILREWDDLPSLLFEHCETRN